MRPADPPDRAGKLAIPAAAAAGATELPCSVPLDAQAVVLTFAAARRAHDPGAAAVATALRLAASSCRSRQRWRRRVVRPWQRHLHHCLRIHLATISSAATAAARPPTLGQGTVQVVRAMPLTETEAVDPLPWSLTPLPRAGDPGDPVGDPDREFAERTGQPPRARAIWFRDGAGRRSAT